MAAGQVKLAVELLSGMRKDGVRPQARHYITALGQELAFSIAVFTLKLGAQVRKTMILTGIGACGSYYWSSFKFWTLRFRASSNGKTRKGISCVWVLVRSHRISTIPEISFGQWNLCEFCRSYG